MFDWGEVAGGGHGRRQRDPGFLLRRGPLPRSRGRVRARDRAARPRAPRCSTSAASRPAPARLPVPADEEAARVIPVIRALAAGSSVPISIDTTKATVAAARARGRGNDRQRRLGRPPRPGPAAASSRMRGPATSPCTCRASRAPCSANPGTDDVLGEVGAFLVERLDAGRGRGHPRRSRSWPIPASGSARPPRTTSHCSRGVRDPRRAGGRAAARRCFAQDVHRSVARGGRPCGPGRRHARHHRLGARSGSNHGPGP